jgi:hypothetical protein
MSPMRMTGGVSKDSVVDLMRAADQPLEHGVTVSRSPATRRPEVQDRVSAATPSRRANLCGLAMA